jgi:hypothetical protein
MSEARPPPPAPDAVWVSFEPEDPSWQWSVVAKDEKVLCSLPCARWITPQAEVFLEYQRWMRTVSVSLPTELGPPGGSVVAVARREVRSARRAGSLLLVGGILLVVMGTLFALLDRSSGDDGSAAALAVGLGGGGAAIGAAVYLRTKGHPDDVVVRTASSHPHPTFALGPGFVEAGSSAPGGFDLILTPLGAVGRF